MTTTGSKPLDSTVDPAAHAGQSRGDRAAHEQLLREFADMMPKLMWTARSDGSIDYVNRHWREFTGISVEQARADGWWAAVHPEDREAARTGWLDAVRRAEPNEVVCRIRRASDASYRWFVHRAAMVGEGDDNAICWLGTATDVDAQERASRVQEFLAFASDELASSLDYEHTLRRIARLAVPKLADWCAVDLLEPDGRLRRVTVTHVDPTKEALAAELVERYPPDPNDPNDGLYRVLRTGETEMLADIPRALLEAGARDEEHLKIILGLDLRSYMIAPLKARGRTCGTFSLIFAESGRRYTQDDRFIVEDLARRAALAIDNARLFREQQHSADEIRSLNEALEVRVRERTAQLEDANRELESFCYSVSHDLRAPLRHISGFARLLDKRAGAVLDAQARSYVETIAAAATQGAALVDDLLEFSRLGRSDLVKTPVALADLIASLLVEFLPETEGRAIDWRIEALPIVQADPTMLRIALANLLSNAIKYTRPRAKPVIEIAARELPDEIELCVRDNGVGFQAEFVHKLFGVFQRLHTAEEFEGTGIGLANVHRIVTRHGGRTWAEGAVDRGAAFYMSLPHATKDLQS